VALILLEHRDSESDDLRRIFAWLDHEGLPGGGPAEFAPPIDVFETATSIEIIADLPGIKADSLRIVFARGNLVIAGQKAPSRCEHHDAAFRLAERTFGRFARVFRLAGAVDAGRTRATLQAGELHVVIPRIDERRGGEIRIPITTG
jgi:HSP20 family protein